MHVKGTSFVKMFVAGILFLFIYLFVYLSLLGRRQLPIRPGGDQRPEEITHVKRDR